MRHRLVRLACAAALGVTTLVAPPAGAETSRGIEIPAFYDPPASIAQQPGTLMRSKPITLSDRLPAPLPAKATRLMYSTIDSRGEATAVTGAYLRSSRPWDGPGLRPLVAFAVGTIGQGDQCAPSIGLVRPIAVGIGSEGATLTLDYDILAMSALLSRGYDVALTDYVGLGTTDRVHTYVNRIDQGHALIDVARAVRALGVARRTPVGFWGYSQGGGAAASAAELHSRYAPRLNVRGTFAGAPPANLRAVLKGIDGNVIAGVAGYALNGFLASYPQIRGVFAETVSATGSAKLKSISTECIGDTVASSRFASTSDWTRTGESLSRVIARSPEARRVIARQRIGARTPAAPVLVTTDVGDNTVPHAQVRTLAVDWCRLGASVDYRPSGAPGGSDRLALHHVAGMAASLAPAMRWMEDRFAGEPVTSDCADLPDMP